MCFWVSHHIHNIEKKLQLYSFSYLHLSRYFSTSSFTCCCHYIIVNVQSLFRKHHSTVAGDARCENTNALALHDNINCRFTLYIKFPTTAILLVKHNLRLDFTCIAHWGIWGEEGFSGAKKCEYYRERKVRQLFEIVLHAMHEIARNTHLSYSN